MPWSLKAQELVRGQYAAVGAASELALGTSVAVLRASVLPRARCRRSDRTNEGETRDDREVPGRLPALLLDRALSVRRARTETSRETTRASRPRERLSSLSDTACFHGRRPSCDESKVKWAKTGDVMMSVT